MAGRGPAPRDPRTLVGGARKQKISQLRIVAAEPIKQPALPESMPGGGDWPTQTIIWWQMWGDSPLASEFTATDWSELLDAAILHAKLWLDGDTKVASELRLRMANFGATPADRARLRIQFATADQAESKSAKTVPASRERRGPLTG